MKYDDTNCQKMDDAPPGVVCPGPAAPVANENCRQPKHNKDDDREVQKKDGIGKSLIGHGGCVCDA